MNQDYSTALSMAGIYVPVDASNITPELSGSLLTPVSALIPIGTTGQYGVLLNGFNFGEKFGVTDQAVIGNSIPAKVRLGILTPDATGRLTINTILIPDAINNASQSIVVADFNKDGIPDIFLAAHNEAPFVAEASTAFMSQSDGTYNKVVLNDQSLAHDAKLIFINGEPAIKAAVYGGDFQPIYKYTTESYLSISLSHWFTKSNDASTVNIYIDGIKAKTVSFIATAGADASGAWSLGQGVIIPINNSSIHHAISFDIDNGLNSGFVAITQITYSDIRIDPTIASHSIPNTYPGFKENWFSSGTMTYDLPNSTAMPSVPHWVEMPESNPGFVKIDSGGRVTYINYFNGASSVIDNFGKNGEAEIVYSDVVSLDSNWQPLNSSIFIFPFDGQITSSTIPIQVITPYLSTLPQYQSTISLNGVGQSHVDRVWSIDLNHDNKPDILAAQSMWGMNTAIYPSAIQVLINNGDGTFRDMTSTLNGDLSLNTDIPDYSPSFIDIDHSGIDTLMFAGNSWVSDANRQSNTILVNDGTGRLYVALHDQFKSIADQVNAFVAAQGFHLQGFVPRFIAVPQSDGSLDFVAQVQISEYENIGGLQVSHAKYAMVNVPLHYNPTTDFTSTVTILDRNGSLLMRTWAGNDTICDLNANASPTSIDGGLGIDTSSYLHTRQQYQVTHKVDGTWGVTQSGAIADSLKNIERLKFSDGYVALDVGATQSAGETQLLLGAVLGKDLLATKQPLIGAVIDLFDHAYTLQQLSGAVMRLPIWDVLTGKAAPTNTDIANYLLWRVNGVTPDATALAGAVSALDAQPDINHNQGDFLWHLAESSTNQAQVGLVGLSATGLAFTV